MARTKRRPTPNFTLRLPALTSRTVWAGIYSEISGTFVMLFGEKPRLDRVLGEYGTTGEYSPESTIDIDHWEHWFGTVQPFVDAGLIEYRGGGVDRYVSIPTLECQKVISIELTASWNEYGQLVGLSTAAD